jgi:predicted transcriptional regulator
VTTTVRISEETHARLAALSAATGQRMQTIVDDAIAAYETNDFWQAFDGGYDALANADNPRSWDELAAEREGEAPSLTDDLG